jgi:hypothetical protein
MTTTDTVAPFVESARAALTELIDANNHRAEQLKAAGNTAALVHEVRDTAETSDPEILKFREMKERALAEILTWEKTIEAYIVAQGLVKTADVDVDALTATWKTTHSQITKMRDVLSMMGGEEAVKSLPAIVGIPGKSGGAAGQSGINRPRFQAIQYQVAGKSEWTQVFVDDTDKENNPIRRTNLTVLGQALTKDIGSTLDPKVTVTSKDLQGPMFDAAGTKDLATLKGEPFSFGFTVGTVNLVVEVTPRVA